MVDATDTAELISEIREERAENEADETFRNRAALLIALLAILLAIGSLGGGNVAEDMVHANIKASDTWAFYQAKNVRQTAYRIAVDELEMQLAAGLLAGPAREAAERQVARYKETIARYDSEPDPAAPGDSLRGEGKQQLSARARSHERARDVAQDRDTSFDLSEVAFQIAILLGSVAILAVSPRILALTVGLGVIGTLLMVNGFLMLVKIPL
ncbi:MAG TPA: DUF4337 domain-containing protein [Longimicrobium sp.]|nr:DUF4337 domain-containing protein [Longimicrobium sp.]